MTNEEITLDMLDPDSREFIEWSMEYLSDPQQYKDFLYECVNRMKNYFSHDPQELKDALRVKFIIGGYEHGSPAKYSAEQVQQEVEKEYQDALGWPLVGLYAQWKRQQKS